ncbi:MAG: hypothetical protein QM820_16835 [Minicystis sp.]
MPVDLQLELLHTELPLAKQDPRSRTPNRMFVLLAWITGAVAVLHVFISDDVPAFGSLWRLLGLFLAIRYLIWRSGLGFRAEAGPQMVLGPASLIIVGPRSARVLPAEKITLVLEQIKFGDEIVGTLDARSDGWAEQLREIAGKAKDDAELRERDRYRRAAERVPLSPAAAWWSHRETQIVGAALAASAVVFLEAGPLHARGARNQALRTEARGITGVVRGVLRDRDAMVRVVQSLVKAEAERARHEKLLAQAQSGDLEGGRAFLAAYPKDEQRAEVQQKLYEACAKKVPAKQGEPQRTRMLRALQWSGCATPGFAIQYATSGEGADARAARSFMQGLADEAAKLANDYQRYRVEPVSADDLPRAGLVMHRLGYAQTWRIDVKPLDAAGKPVAGADHLAIFTLK